MTRIVGPRLGFWLSGPVVGPAVHQSVERPAAGSTGWATFFRIVPTVSAVPASPGDRHCPPPRPRRHPMSASTYDVLPYESLPFAQTHPDRLAGIATLLGL